MLFNSYAFIFGFLPLVLIGYSIAGLFHRRAVVIWLGIASLAFYAYWYPPFLLVLGTSILFNYSASILISQSVAHPGRSRLVLWVAISGNLLALCWFKYFFPFLHFLGDLFHFTSRPGVLLPLGISFFTFTQIAFLVDLQQGAATRQDFPSYLLFVTFFPHVIAGPILHHKDIMPQFQQNRAYRLQASDLAVGSTWFVMGLFKKVILADRFAKTADAVFQAHGTISAGFTWAGVLSYALQLYFDFSGYCDMANGLARMLSIDFPLNFSSPYKASNIIDFWQRWHMTLTQYIGAYLYSPLQFHIFRKRREQGKAVTRKAQATSEGFLHMIAYPTIFTMFIAGVWHGAGSQFLVFGVLHGIYLTVAHAWRIFRPVKGKLASWHVPWVTHAASVLLTFLCVVVAQVFFRAPSSHDAVVILERLFHVHASRATEVVHVSYAKLLFIAIGFTIVWAFPNTQQILARFKPALQLSPSDGQSRLLPIYWSPTLLWGVGAGLALIFSLVRLQDPSTFLYFQF